MEKYISPIYQIPLSDEQKAVFDLIGQGESVAVDSGPGTGKTHTANACCYNWSGPVELVPFARSLMNEQAEKFKGHSHINVVNFYSRGKRMLGHVRLDQDKCKDLALELVEGEPMIAKKIGDLAKLLKIEGYGVYKNALEPDQVAVKYNLFLTEKEMDLAPAPLEDLAVKVVEKSDTITKIIDFEDMLRLPIVLGLKSLFPKTALVGLDEVQDFTPLAFQFIIDCLVPQGATVLMIGDPSRQSLQQFAGASPSLFDEMADHFGCKRLEMVQNRRCAKAIVRNAPFGGNMESLPDAPEGIVESLPEESVIAEIMAGGYANDALLCETNAPLISLGIKLLTNDIPVRMRTAKIDKLIFRYAYKHITNKALKVGEIAPLMQAELAENIGDGKDVSEFADMIKCIDALETYCLAKGILKTAWINRRPAHPIQQALKELTSGKEGISLMTGHTSKGLEWDTVFYLPAKMKAPEQDWQVHQNECLALVIATRAKTRFVTLVTSE